jgi:hypothetical protein
MNFQQALEHEGRNLVDAIDQPAGRCCGAATYVGPTRVDFSPLSDGQHERMAQDQERGLLQEWKAQDLAAYYRQTGQGAK